MCISMSFVNATILILQICIPFLLSYFVALYQRHRIISDSKRNISELNLLTLLSRLGLTELPLFWGSITLCVSLYIAFSLPIWINYEIDLSPTGYSNFIELTTLPTILLAIALPLIAAIARAHSTHQSAEQIAKTELNLKIEAHYKYKDEFKSALQDLANSFSNSYKDYAPHISMQNMFYEVHEYCNGYDIPDLNHSRIFKLVDSLTTIDKNVRIINQASQVENSDNQTSRKDIISSIEELTPSIIDLEKSIFNIRINYRNIEPENIKIMELRLDEIYLLGKLMKSILFEIIDINFEHQSISGKTSLEKFKESPLNEASESLGELMKGIYINVNNDFIRRKLP